MVTIRKLLEEFLREKGFFVKSHGYAGYWWLSIFSSEEQRDYLASIDKDNNDKSSICYTANRIDRGYTLIDLRDPGSLDKLANELLKLRKMRN